MKINVAYLICRETGILLSITYTGCVQLQYAFLCANMKCKFASCLFWPNVTQDVTFVLLKQTESVFSWGLSLVWGYKMHLWRGKMRNQVCDLKIELEHCLKQANKDIPTFCSSPVIRRCFHEYSKLPPWLGWLYSLYSCTFTPAPKDYCSVFNSLLPSGNELQHFFPPACCFLCYNIFNIQGTFISSTCSIECDSKQLLCHKSCNRDSTNNRILCKTQIKPGRRPRQTSSAYGFMEHPWANTMRLSTLACKWPSSLSRLTLSITTPPPVFQWTCCFTTFPVFPLCTAFGNKSASHSTFSCGYERALR